MYWPMLVHFCEDCRYNTPVSYSPTVWQQEHNCSHCGLKSTGADIAGRSEATMNATQHDELAQLFAQNMQLSYQAAQQQQQQQQQQEPIEVDHVATISEKQDHPIHYASAHYTGTAHIRPDTTSEPSRSPPPPYQEMPDGMAEVLRQNSIDPSALLPAQIHLFANADYEQRLRLLELWRIAPPSYPLELHLQPSFHQTSMEQETAEARERYERKQGGWQGNTFVPPPEEHMLDTHIIEPTPISPIREAGDPAWPPAARMRAASIAAKYALNANTAAEPYMSNGYKAPQPYQSAVDPVYAAGGVSYGMQLMQQDKYASTMEDQYGQYAQIRNHADWEAMNERVARERFVGLHGPASDDEMEL